MIDIKWVKRFIDLAAFVGSWSKDPSTKAGSVLTRGNRVISMGFNGFPAGTDDHHHLYEDREVKYLRVVHAELNSILFAKEDLLGTTIYVTHFPCSQCAAAMIQKGISYVVFPLQNKSFLDRWADSIKHTLRMFKESGIMVYQYNDTENTVKQICGFHEFFVRKV